MSFYNSLDYDLQTSLEDTVRDNPGIAGLKLVSYVQKELSSADVSKEEVFEVIDRLLEENVLWCDFEEDEWYLYSEVPYDKVQK
tara:strand:- start:356 stop:607 length:252 start_codon:yes stop_codon:yes gene_type:complete